MTTEVLESWVAGRWQGGSGDGTVVRDAVTGDEVVRVTSDGLDLAEVARYAREVGGPALRALDFGQRAAVLKQVAAMLDERKEELYELSARAGSTRRDSAVDVDGGIGTTFVYSSLGRKGLPAGHVIVEGPPEPLGKNGTFAGQHVLTSPHGLALQINAFNFPVWGMLEKLAPALLAGVPTVVKPATPTAYVAARAVRILDEAGVLPEGALQLVCGSLGDFFDLLGGQDHVGFTGSAHTAALLRSHAAVTSRSARFNAEADSLNCSVLGPDATPGTPEFDLFVKERVREMTVKAGQKCTAIRRALVPAEQLTAVAEAASERLSKVVVGAPGAEGVTMGALVGLEQRDDVRAAAGVLASAGRLVHGDPHRVDVVGADAEAGAFLAPLLVEVTDADRPEPHEVEAFGPVSTLLPYRDTPQLLDLIARGEGSLVGSVVSHDAGFVRDVVLGAAPFHGRLLVLDRDDAGESTGHGIPMPQLMHGGPGRAGGGEEEGGLRGVHAHLQRTAVQAGPRQLAALFAAEDPQAEK
jgi:oxepin-CoA hydrolase/3-oxo-5,6-dehydrosuberyl-CoA semialdehyde dehydrogenase